jgi:hypothetical protein
MNKSKAVATLICRASQRPFLLGKSMRIGKVTKRAPEQYEPPVERRDLTPQDRAIRERIAIRRVADKYISQNGSEPKGKRS